MERNSAYAKKLGTAKWLFAVAVLLFVAKPFVGFSLNPSNPITQSSILVKSFTKRKHDYIENSQFDVKTVQKQLANPVVAPFLLFSCLLTIILPRLFNTGGGFTGSFIQRIKPGSAITADAWLLDGQLII